VQKACRDGALNNLKKLFEIPHAEKTLRIMTDAGAPIHLAATSGSAECVEYVVHSFSCFWGGERRGGKDRGVARYKPLTAASLDIC
jgi:hypothetical protein